ncbi:glycosyltransferase family 4 protein [Citreimonas salinaria]|uniref:Glycosyltransferase involved in cell wall bisynthesis n=1 Tax=Citreimonas salinaria TaxID=321339 RepID=A0A1H3EZK0_9RHOB|nr:glycosyltransferase family 1 protein [Citreimonas salinaria]SDX84025.1 Glycosyltransferase involved in cell wall bisynthesis [Citreimonas salinaria]
MTHSVADPLKVVLLMRAPQGRSFSVEAVFTTVADHMPDDIEASYDVSPHVSKGILRRLRAAFHARRAARGADVAHVTGDTHFVALALPRRRTVLTVHDCEFLDRSRGIKRFILWLFWMWWPVRHAAAITVVSETSKAQLLQWLRLDPARIEVVENPLSKRLPRSERPLDMQRPRLLMIGTEAHKNIARVAEAVADLPVTLAVIGRLPDELRARIGALGVPLDARFDLSDAELAEAYARADILMFPSLSEGFGLPIIEAQSVGRPVVTSDRSPMREVAGDAALLVDPVDPDTIRAAVVRLMKEPDLVPRLVADGLLNVNRFAPSLAAERYAQIYRRVAEQAE